MKKYLNAKARVLGWILSLVTMTTVVNAQTADLTSHQPTAAPPSGGTFEWHSALPVSSANLVATPSAVSAGLYYGVYNFTTCYSDVAPLRVGSTTCPVGTADLNTFVSSTTTPAGMTATFHSSSPATDGNMLSGTSITSAAAGTYYVAYRDNTSGCYSYESVLVIVDACSSAVAGTIDCSKTQIIPAPVAGTSGQHTLVVWVNVTTAGCFTPLVVSGSGMSVANGVTQLCATTTGLQAFHIPVKYDGTTLSTLNFTIGSPTNAGSCSADLTTTPKKAITDVWTLDCVPTIGPALK